MLFFLISTIALLVISIVLSITLFKSRVSKTEHEVLKAEKSTCDNLLSEVKTENANLKSNITNNINIITQLEKDKSTLEADKRSMEERLQQHKSDLESLERRFKIEFENLSNTILSRQTEKFNEQSKNSLDSLLKPLKTDLENINKSLVEEGKSKAYLAGTIKEIVESSSRISQQSENLTNALKGDSKVQGNWGEVLLEKILEESGLRVDKDYTLQGANIKLRNPNDDSKYIRPDVIVNLPDDKHIVIDSKISLTSYERYFTDDAASKAEHLSNHIKSIKKHVNDLSSKRYQDAEKITTPEFVLMFIGVEGAYSLAVQSDFDLISYAWDKRIVIVCPSTLFATLRTIASVWRLEMQNANAIKIAKQGGALYDKFVGFVEDMQKLGNQLKNASDCHSSSMGKLSEGRGNILNRVQELQKLGIKSSKKLPTELIDSIDDDLDVENLTS